MRTLLYGVLLCGPLLAAAAEPDVPKERTLAVNVEAAGGLFAFATACEVPEESLGTLVKMDARAAGEYAEVHGIAFTQDDFRRHFARGMDANRQFIRGRYARISGPQLPRDYRKNKPHHRRRCCRPCVQLEVSFR